MSDKHVTFNALQFLRDSNIVHTQEGRHGTKNRVQIHCPFCAGSIDFHLGIHLTKAYSNCWRCGPHSIAEVIHRVLRVTWREVYAIIDEYANVTNVHIVKSTRRSTKQKLVLPDGGLLPLNKKHRKYIQNRHFDVDHIIDTWGIQSTGPLGVDKHRIYIPIMYLGAPVSYQCRTHLKNVDTRYLTCPPNKEKIFHKDILYGIDYAQTNTVVIVEGITDVWRLGAGALCTFGTMYTPQQMYQITKFDNVYILFDSEVTAQKKAEKLANEVAMINKGSVHIITSDVPGQDPGDLPQHEADALMQDILLR